MPKRTASAARVYTAREASHLSGLTPFRLGQWARHGYIPSGMEDGRRMFSYRDAAEAIAVHKSLLAGFNPRNARKAVNYLRDGCGDFLRDDIETAVEKRRSATNDLSRGGWAYVELGDLEHISVDPECMSGTPTIRGTRIQAMFVGKEARSEGGLRILRGYRLSDEQINDAARWRDKALSYAPGPLMAA